MLKHRRRQAGFSFIEILVVMGIISVLATMVVVLIPVVTERGNRTKSIDNLRSITTTIMTRGTGRTSGKWPRFDGKNFVLSVVAYPGGINAKNERALATLFSPGDELYTTDVVDFKRYQEVKVDALKSDADFHELTSYAGRRNRGRDYLLSQKSVEEGALIMCDDDDGPLHHTAGLCCAFADGSTAFMEWEEFGMVEPEEDAQFLGEEAENEELEAIRGR